ncbi:MAG: FMN-binding negative transcriptional regulator [Dehalococcoidia bacterium]|nr:FMN-binding negative transcriptional regulator [Dehalococcoidia bacterium]
MYLPKYYEVTNRLKLFDFMKSNNFGILFSHTGEEPMANHLPFIIDDAGGDNGLILGHMAKANRQWRFADGQQVMVVFHGPHAYVSPTWYQGGEAVPTWNYTAVHANGIFTASDDPVVMREMVERLTVQHEESQPQPWKMDFSTRYAEQMMKRVVTFKIEITSLQGKWKLSQNQSDVRRERVTAKLGSSEHEGDQQVARLMEEDMSE